MLEAPEGLLADDADSRRARFEAALSVFRRVGFLSCQESLPKKLDAPFRIGCLWRGQQLLR